MSGRVEPRDSQAYHLHNRSCRYPVSGLEYLLLASSAEKIAQYFFNFPGLTPDSKYRKTYPVSQRAIIVKKTGQSKLQARLRSRTIRGLVDAEPTGNL